MYVLIIIQATEVDVLYLRPFRQGLCKVYPRTLISFVVFEPVFQCVPDYQLLHLLLFSRSFSESEGKFDVFGGQFRKSQILQNKHSPASFDLAFNFIRQFVFLDFFVYFFGNFIDIPFARKGYPLPGFVQSGL